MGFVSNPAPGRDPLVLIGSADIGSALTPINAANGATLARASGVITWDSVGGTLTMPAGMYSFDVLGLPVGWATGANSLFGITLGTVTLNAYMNATIFGSDLIGLPSLQTIFRTTARLPAALAAVNLYFGAGVVRTPGISNMIFTIERVASAV